MTAHGTLIAESLRPGAPLEGVPLTVSKVTRVGPLADLMPGQPPVWTLVEFAVDDEQAPELAERLAAALDRELWYCDFRTEDETFVVFAGRTFRYARGDVDGRGRAAAHARSCGLPETQIDWPE